MTTFIKRILGIILVMISMQVEARWATFADAPFQVLASNSVINIEQDGTAEITFETQIKVLNESGRDAFSAVPLYYVKDNSELEILTASITNDGKSVVIDRDTIEDKPLASAIKGFDQKHQVLIAFPNVQVNSVIYIKYKKRIIKPDLPGFYETSLKFVEQYIQNATVTYKSKLPLYYNSNDPDNYISITKDRDDKLYTLTVRLNKPIYIDIVDENQSNINIKKYPWVYVATSNKAGEINQQIAEPYLKVMQQPLPTMYQEIVEKASTYEEPIKRINTVMSMLNEQLQYMGDWQSSNGRLVPQDLARVAQRGLGDCKDFATGTAVMLNKLGMQANVALVFRHDGIYYGGGPSLPGLTFYNHAIVRVQSGKQVYWVDPTNFYSIADVVLPDIADRPSLVLSINTRKEHIPRSTPDQNYSDSIKNINLRNPSVAKVSGTFSLHGLAAIHYTGAELVTSKNTIINSVLDSIGNYEYMFGQKLNMPDLTSRVVRDLQFTYEFQEKDFVSISNAGYITSLSDGTQTVGSFILNPEQVSDIYLGAPISGKKVYNFSNVAPQGTKPLDAQLRSKWLDITRTVSYSDNSVQVTYDFKVKESWIANDTMRSKEYQRMAQQLSQEFSNGISIVFD